MILQHSPYLTAINAESCTETAAPALERLLQETHTTVAKSSDAETLMKTLRQAKKKLAALTAAADLKGEWNEAAAMLALSRFADLAVSSALGFLLKASHEAKTIKLKKSEGTGKKIAASPSSRSANGARMS